MKNFLFLLSFLLYFSALNAQKMHSPTELGFDQERLTLIDDYVNQKITQQKIGGAVVLIARKGKIAHYQAYGKADKAKDLAMKKDDIFEIMSMTKPVVATATMQLYERGKLYLNDPVSKYIPAFKDLKVARYDDKGVRTDVPLQRAITIRDLLTHTSGIPYGFSLPPGELKDMWDKFDYPPTYKNLEEFTSQLVALPLAHQPGERWTYGRSFGILGRVIEIVSGQTLEEYLEANIFKPLGMSDTGFDLPDEKLPRLTSLHVANPKDGQMIAVRSSQAYQGGVQTLFYGGGGLLSTATDYNIFCQMILNGGIWKGKRILGRKTLEMMTATHVQNFEKNSADYGLGFAIQKDLGQSLTPISKGSLYWSGMYNTYFWIDPQEEMVAILMTQVFPYGYPDIIEGFRVLVNGAIND